MFISIYIYTLCKHDMYVDLHGRFDTDKDDSPG